MSAATSTDTKATATTTAPATATTASEQQSVLFVSHGAGPCFFMDAEDGMFATMNSKSAPRKWFDSMAAKYITGAQPKAILVVSAHWEEHALKVTSRSGANELLFDYGGFPPETYELKYPALGSTAIAKEVMSLLNAANLPCTAESKRGLDHGVFVPLLMMFPKADIPVLQLSLMSNLNPAQHVAIGRALRPLRAQGVLIVASGQVTHGRPRSDLPNYAKQFDAWLTSVVTNPDAKKRADLLIDFEKQCAVSKYAHPRAEHLIPMMVAVGAAGDDTGKQIYDAMPVPHFSLGCYQFGGAAASAAAPTAAAK